MSEIKQYVEEEQKTLTLKLEKTSYDINKLVGRYSQSTSTKRSLEDSEMVGDTKRPRISNQESISPSVPDSFPSPSGSSASSSASSSGSSSSTFSSSNVSSSSNGTSSPKVVEDGDLVYKSAETNFYFTKLFLDFIIKILNACFASRG